MIPLALKAADSMISSSLLIFSGLGFKLNSGLSKSLTTPLVDVIIARGLLISWAIPVASSPTDASLEA